MPNKGSRKTTDFVRHFSILMHENKLFVKYSTAHRLLNQCPRLAYGQNADFWDLPVKHSPRLRAERRFLGFARRYLTSRLPKRTKQRFSRSLDRCNATTSHHLALHFNAKKAESPLHPRKFRIDHPNVPYLTTITEQGAF